MILKTLAICIKNTRYGESSVISKMFSLEFGLCAFMAQGINRKSSAIKPSHLTPGNILELVIYQKPNASIHRIKELKIQTPLLQIHTDFRKNAVLQFMLEIIAKTSEEQHKDEIVFNFLKTSILDLEARTEDFGMAPFYFLSQYLKFSGWFPNLEVWEDGMKFNIVEGRFEHENDLGSEKQLSSEHSKSLYQALLSVQNNTSDFKEIAYKRELFNTLLTYFELHLLKGKKIKSPTILAEVFS
jgi:DNA repair protein RecO (recombination protein O)